MRASYKAGETIRFPGFTRAEKAAPQSGSACPYGAMRRVYVGENASGLASAGFGAGTAKAANIVWHMGKMGGASFAA